MTAATLPAGTSIAAARRWLAGALAERHFDTPDLDARVLIGHALGRDHAALIREADRALAPAEIDAVAAVAERRLRREPVARITGVKEFWSLPFAVNAATLVPRPETETVVEAALAAIDAGGGRAQPLRLIDIGTGSGALLLALLSECRNAFGIGTDISVAALATARRNARDLGLRDRAAFVACDIAAAVRGPFDLAVSNPPYVEHAAIASLPPGVRDYEPHRALDGGHDGLDAYRAIAAQVPALLSPGGHLVVELGAGQDAAVASIFQRAGLAATSAHHDLNGILRAVCVTRI
jgi:release factor glutamine methyltransferase